MHKHLTQNEHYYIWLSLATFISISKIGQNLKVARSTVQRELKRNCRSGKAYEPYYAQAMSEAKQRLRTKEI